jgi:allantoicase
MSFTEYIDLAGERVGGKVLLANDDFFAAKENLIKASTPVFIPEKFTPQGKWMDGWETRRRRTPGYDWCVVRLGFRGVVRGVDVETTHFTGNYPESCSIEACDAPRAAAPKALLKDPALWTEVLQKTPLKGGSHNQFPIRSLRPWTHLRLNIYPDGGVARLRVYGDIVPDWERVAVGSKLVDLAAVENGGRAVSQSDMYFGRATNMLMPGRAKNMGDGWETKRRRGPGHDWCVIKLGAAGIIEKLELDTNHFKGNYPDSFTLEGCLAPSAQGPELSSSDIAWSELVGKTKLKPHHRHFLSLSSRTPVSHVRLSIYPDGGVSRLRLWGRLDRRSQSHDAGALQAQRAA